jgi:hypothetical protein
MSEQTYWVKLTVVMAVRAKGGKQGPKRAAQRAHDIATRQGLFVYDVVDSVDAEEMYRHIMPASVNTESPAEGNSDGE